MSSVQDIEQAISRLRPEDLAEFRVWFAEFDAGVWDLQTEEDARAGRLDELANEALADLREGRGREL